MTTVVYRPDYAKFVFELPRGLFATYYTRFCEASHEIKYTGDFLRSHKVTALRSMDPDAETTVLEIWGEWAGLVEHLSGYTWFRALKRFDVRAVVWDADKEAVINVGQRLQREVTGYNVNVYNTRPATKRQGRDRGGVGFAVGSHKSDLRITVYKRTSEPVAQEFQCTGAMLSRLKAAAEEHMGLRDDVYYLFTDLKFRIQAVAEARMARVFEAADIGTYWPAFRREERDEYAQLGTAAGFWPSPEEQRELMADAPSDWFDPGPVE